MFVNSAALPMKTLIGQNLLEPRKTQMMAGLIAACAVTTDMLIVRSHRFIDARGAAALLAVAILIGLMRGDLQSAGLRISPLQGWHYWARMTLVIGLAVASLLFVYGSAIVLSGFQPQIPSTPPHAVVDHFLQMCVFAPILEEAIYRFVLCAPMAALISARAAIVVSGLMFALLHSVYGNPSPENLVAGFFLGWAYLKSGSILVPVILHSLGNGCALAAHVANWYWLQT